jgi:hypothetical protein
VVNGKILSLDNLRKQHVIVIDKCYMCKNTGESVDHLLLLLCYCSFLCFVEFSLQSFQVVPSYDQTGYRIACWWSFGRLRTDAVWKMASICLFWCLWSEMNNKSFEDLERSLKEILSFFYHTLYLWTTAYVYPLLFSFDVFLACFSLSN